MVFLVTENGKFLQCLKGVVTKTYSSSSNEDLTSILIEIGMYTYEAIAKRRAKINMVNGTISALTSEELDKVPVGTHRTIMLNFMVGNLQILA